MPLDEEPTVPVTFAFERRGLPLALCDRWIRIQRPFRYFGYFLLKRSMPFGGCWIEIQRSLLLPPWEIFLRGGDCWIWIQRLRSAPLLVEKAS